MSSMRFVGRNRELSLLAGLVAALRAGVGGVVALDGEQGIGKTALLRAGLGGADRLGCRVLWASASELRRPFPLRLMLECVGSQGGATVPEGDLAHPVLGTDPVLAASERLLAAVDRLCAAGPVVLVAEDLQWADDASVLVWRKLSRAADQVPLLLAGSWRQGMGRTDLEQVRRAVVARGGKALRLAPLPSQDVAALVAGVVGGRPGRRLAGLLARAGGNPLYIRELAEGLVRDGRVRVDGGVAEVASGGARVPVALEAAITGRLTALAADEVAVLRWAAVLGPECSVRDLEVVTGLSAGELSDVVDSASAAGVVARAGGQLGFRHELIRWVLYQGMPQSLRSALHARAAQALAGAGAPAEQVAAQLVPGQREPDAMVVTVPLAWLADWLAGGAAALMHRAPNVAADLLRGALSRLPDGDERREALEAALVTVAFLLVLDEEVERAGDRLLGYARDPDLAADAAWRVGYAVMRTGRPLEAVASVEKALHRPGTSDLWMARLSALRALSMGFAGQPTTVDAARQALAAAEGAHDRFAAGYALYTLCLVDFYRRDHASALGHIEHALAAIGDDPQITDLRLLLLPYRAHALEHLDRQGEAGTAIRETLALAERAGTPRMATICTVAAEHYFKVGLWDDALAVLEQATPLPGPDYGQPQLHGLRALIAGHRDDGSAAQEHLATAGNRETDSISHRATMHFLLLARALAAERAGRPGEAIAVLAVSLDPAVKRDLTYRFLFFPLLVRLALATGDAATAAAAAAAAAREAEREPLPVKVAAAGFCRGLLDGDPAPLLAAAEYYKSASRPLEGAQALEDAAVLLAERGDLKAARQAFGEAVRLYRGLGAQWDIRRGAARLTGYGIRPSNRGRRAATTGWEALTPTETKIAYLIARGQSNPDIAAELWLSRNTVQTHVSHILTKLSARSRAEIAREALRAAWQPMTAEARGSHVEQRLSGNCGIGWVRPADPFPVSSVPG